MAANGAFERVEAEYKKPMAEILPPLFEQFGSQQKVARHLKVSQSTISKWLGMMGFKTWTVIKPCADPKKTSSYNNQYVAA